MSPLCNTSINKNYQTSICSELQKATFFFSHNTKSKMWYAAPMVALFSLAVFCPEWFDLSDKIRDMKYRTAQGVYQYYESSAWTDSKVECNNSLWNQDDPDVDDAIRSARAISCDDYLLNSSLLASDSSGISFGATRFVCNNGTYCAHQQRVCKIHHQKSIRPSECMTPCADTLPQCECYKTFVTSQVFSSLFFSLLSLCVLSLSFLSHTGGDVRTPVVPQRTR